MLGRVTVPSIKRKRESVNVPLATTNLDWLAGWLVTSPLPHPPVIQPNLPHTQIGVRGLRHPCHGGGSSSPRCVCVGPLSTMCDAAQAAVCASFTYTFLLSIMECLFGITGKDYTIIAADTTSARSIVVMKGTEDKSRDLNDHTVMVFSGEPGDTVNFAEYIQRNIRLYKIRNDIDLSPKAAATFTRRELADSLRSRVMYI